MHTRRFCPYGVETGALSVRLTLIVTPPLPPVEVGTPPAVQATSNAGAIAKPAFHRSPAQFAVNRIDDRITERRRRQHRLHQLAVCIEDVDEGRVAIGVTTSPSTATTPNHRMIVWTSEGLPLANSQYL